MASKPKSAGKAAAPAKKAAGKGKAAGGAIAAAEPKIVKKVLTQEDLELNPQLVADGYKVGDEVEVEDENAGDEGVEAAASANKVATPKKNATEVDVIKGSEYVRTFSEEVHGDDFLAIAEEYCESNEGSEIVDSDSLKIVVVNYRQLDKKTGVSTDTSKSFSAKDGEDFKARALAFKNEMNGAAVIRR